MPKRSSMPADPNQLAVAVVTQATGETPEKPKPRNRRKDPAAVALGCRGGKRDGCARAGSLTAEQRGEIARRAARAEYGLES